MRIVMFYHSLVSDWNHGNAHFLRGIVTELQARGHEVRVYEPQNAWSLQNLRHDRGEAAVAEFRAAYPGLRSSAYALDAIDLQRELEGADLVLVHEWNEHELVRRIGEHRARHDRYRLLFHDTHHRSATDPAAIGGYDLSHYDGVLAFGNVVRDSYLAHGWAKRAWTWHEAADLRVFHPWPRTEMAGDLVWVGNWGDEERTAELHEFLIDPVRELGLKAMAYGVRYPQEGREALAQVGIGYGGWLANYRVPEVFAQYRVTVHIPRRPYVEALPGIPTIRVFEALASGIPLICSPWQDAEHLFAPGEDYLIARDGGEMKALLRALLADETAAQALAAHGRRTIVARHTCGHRVDQLLSICGELGLNVQTDAVRRAA